MNDRHFLRNFTLPFCSEMPDKLHSKEARTETRIRIHLFSNDLQARIFLSKNYTRRANVQDFFILRSPQSLPQEIIPSQAGVYFLNTYSAYDPEQGKYPPWLYLFQHCLFRICILDSWDEIYRAGFEAIEFICDDPEALRIFENFEKNTWRSYLHLFEVSLKPQLAGFRPTGSIISEVSTDSAEALSFNEVLSAALSEKASVYVSSRPEELGLRLFESLSKAWLVRRLGLKHYLVLKQTLLQNPSSLLLQLAPPEMELIALNSSELHLLKHFRDPSKVHGPERLLDLRIESTSLGPQKKESSEFEATQCLQKDLRASLMLLPFVMEVKRGHISSEEWPKAFERALVLSFDHTPEFFMSHFSLSRFYHLMLAWERLLKDSLIARSALPETSQTDWAHYFLGMHRVLRLREAPNDVIALMKQSMSPTGFSKIENFIENPHRAIKDFGESSLYSMSRQVSLETLDSVN